MSRISVIIPAKNEEDKIAEAVSSVIGQSHPPDEVFVIDDKSTDATGEIAEEHGAQVIRGKGKGIGWAEQQGLLESTGDFISVLCGDDWWPPWTLKVQAKHIRKGYGLVHGQAALVGEGNRIREVFGRPGCFGDFTWGNYIIEDTVMARRDLMMLEGGYDTDLERNPDFDMWVRVCRAGKSFFIPKVLLYRRPSTKGRGFKGRYFRSRILIKHRFLSRDHLSVYWRSRSRVQLASSVIWASIRAKDFSWLRRTGLLDVSTCPHMDFPR